MKPTLEFWFDYSSPFAYLASTQVESLAARTEALLVWKPMLLGGLFKLIGTPIVPLQAFPGAKNRHTLLDLHRWADHWGVPFQYPTRFPMRTVAALRMALGAGDRIAPFSHGVFRAYWVDDEDLDDSDTLIRIADEAGLDGPALLEGTQDPALKQELIDRTNEAAARGICGAPSFFVGDELFWGQDRLHFVEAALRHAGSPSESEPDELSAER